MQTAKNQGRQRPSNDHAVLAQKIALYCSEVTRLERIQEHMPGLSLYAGELAARGDRATLMHLSGEVDVLLREAHDAPIALAVVATMQDRGIPSRYLPVLPSARRLRAIAERGAIRTATEASLVQAVLDTPELTRLLDRHAAVLGAALDRWRVA